MSYFADIVWSLWKVRNFSLMFCLLPLYRFEYRPRNAPKNENGESETVEITVYDYFLKERNLELQYSADLPCVNVGRPKRPTYIPLEVSLFFPSWYSLVFMFSKFILKCVLFCGTFCSTAHWFPFRGTQRLWTLSKDLPWLRNLDRSRKRGWMFCQRYSVFTLS